MKKFVLAALIAVIALSGCDGPAGPGESSDITALDIGRGGTAFRFEVTDDTGTVTAWNVRTDEATVGAALLEAGLIGGDLSALGLYVTEVNGLTADFSANGSWWEFFIDGEPSMAGVDSTDIDPEKRYAFVYRTS